MNYSARGLQFCFNCNVGRHELCQMFTCQCRRLGLTSLHPRITPLLRNGAITNPIVLNLFFLFTISMIILGTSRQLIVLEGLFGVQLIWLYKAVKGVMNLVHHE